MTEKQQKLEEYINQKLAIYFDQLDGKIPCNVYHMVVGEAETAVIRHVMQYCDHNQSKASKILGISRGSLRNKVSKYDIS